MTKRIFEVAREEKTTITVCKLTAALIKDWAKRHRLTMSEAVWLMAGRTFVEEAGGDFTQSPYWELMQPKPRN